MFVGIIRLFHNLQTFQTERIALVNLSMIVMLFATHENSHRLECLVAMFSGHLSQTENRPDKIIMEIKRVITVHQSLIDKQLQQGTITKGRLGLHTPEE